MKNADLRHTPSYDEGYGDGYDEAFGKDEDE